MTETKYGDLCLECTKELAASVVKVTVDGKREPLGVFLEDGQRCDHCCKSSSVLVTCFYEVSPPEALSFATAEQAIDAWFSNI